MRGHGRGGTSPSKTAHWKSLVGRSAIPRHKTVAIVTARGGSKGLPRKNIATLNGRPLIEYTIAAAKGCALITETYVTTDDAEIAAISAKFGAFVIDRPPELASDSSPSADAVIHALESLAAQGKKFEYFVLLQPTSPLRTARHLTDCLTTFFGGSFASAIAVCESEHHPAKMLSVTETGRLVPLHDPASLDKPRQSLPKIYRQNGAIYAMRCDDFLTGNQSFFREPAMPFIMSREDSIDIDDALDLMLARMIFEQMRR